MRLVIGVLVGLTVALVVGLLIASGEKAQAPEPAVRRIDVRPIEAHSSPRLPPVLRPVPDPSATTPRPGTTARRRAPDASARLPIHVELALPGGAAPAHARIHWSRSESGPFGWMQWQEPRTVIYVEPGDVWLYGSGGPQRGQRSEPMHLVLRRGEPRPSVHLVLREP